MPVIRELINRISFKVNPGDKAKAEDAMKGVESAGASTIRFFKGLERAIKKTLKAIGLLTVAGAKMFTEYEQNQAVSRFFSRSTEEAKKLSDALDKLSGSEIISKREREQAEAALSKLTVPVDQIAKILPVLEDITISRPDLDFEQVVGLTTQFVKTGDIDALENLGAVSKDTAEAFRLSQLNASTAIKGQRNLFQFMSEGLDRNKEKIKENADAVKDDLGFSFKGLAKEASDFTLQFGKTTAPEVKEIVTIIRDLIKELNESDEFWDSVKEGAEATLAVIKEAIELAKILAGDEEEEAGPTQRQALDAISRTEGAPEFKEEEAGSPASLRNIASSARDIFDKGFFEASRIDQEKREKFKEQQAEKARRGEASKLNLPIRELIEESTGIGFGGGTGKETLQQKAQGKGLFKIIADLLTSDSNGDITNQESVGGINQGGAPQKTVHEISFAPLVIQGENTQNLDMESIQSDINRAILGEVKDTLINVAAQTGRLVGVSG